MSPQLTPAALAAALETFLTEHPRASVVEEGAVLFDMAYSRWTLETTGGRCVLQLWNDERNLVRTVTGLETRRNALRLECRRFGQNRPQHLRLVPDRDLRTPSARELTRRRYAQLLARVLARAFPDLKQGETFAAADLEHSFGPAYVRLLLERSQSVWAVVAINAEETQSSVDGILTVAVLWLARCRERLEGRRVIEGVRVIVPTGMASTLRERLPWLHPGVAKWQLLELDEQRETLEPCIDAPGANLRAHLVAAFDPVLAMERSKAAIEQVLALVGVPDRARVEVLARSAIEISFRLHGLEFARARHGVSTTSFAREIRITFGAGGSETPLNEETEPLLRELVHRLFLSRHPGGSTRDPLFRLQPERWLEAALRADLPEIESSLAPAPVYTQVPALALSDRGLLDLLAVTRDGRLAVLELKAAEDLHMPLQGLDYWMRVGALHAAGEITRSRYFPGVELSPEPPLLYFVVPALRVHSTLDTILRHLSPEIEWRLLALDEQWRKRRAVVFRKSGGTGKGWPRLLAGQP